MGELSRPSHVRQRRAADVHIGERVTQALMETRDRLEGDVMTLGGQAHDLPQHDALVGADVDRIGALPEHGREHDPGGVVVAQLAALGRIECQARLTNPREQLPCSLIPPEPGGGGAGGAPEGAHRRPWRRTHVVGMLASPTGGRDTID